MGVRLDLQIGGGPCTLSQEIGLQPPISQPNVAKRSKARSMSRSSNSFSLRAAAASSPVQVLSALL